MHSLILVRHGKTEWSRQNRFAGWADAELSASGIEEARRAGAALAAAGYRFDLCHTSYLSRAARTLEIMLEALGQSDLPVARSWRLNERHYGDLQGSNRAKMALQHGNEKLANWRRGFDSRPPALPDNDPRLPERDQLYADVDPALLPRGESLADAAARVAPYWREDMVPQLRAGKRLLVVAHTASIRGLVTAIEGLDDTSAAAFRIATAIPLAYSLDDDLKVLEKQTITSGWSSRLRHFLNKRKPGSRISWV